jgi:KDO2-lipid IV(A) lauroyltransferase
MARLSGAAVLAFAHQRRPDGGYDLRLSPAFAGFPSRDATADTAVVMGKIEAMVRAAPEQYLWIHRRFKHQPGGVGDPYR